MHGLRRENTLLQQSLRFTQTTHNGGLLEALCDLRLLFKVFFDARRANDPRETALIRMPLCPYSEAELLVSKLTPLLAAAYAVLWADRARGIRRNVDDASTGFLREHGFNLVLHA